MLKVTVNPPFQLPLIGLEILGMKELAGKLVAFSSLALAKDLRPSHA
jgi:hypothetical protein